MSDTPLTDARAMFFGYNPEEGDEFVQADFARNLERQNIAMREMLQLVLSNIPGVAKTTMGETIRQSLDYWKSQE